MGGDEIETKTTVGPSQATVALARPAPEPTLFGAYLRLLFFGLVGGHHLYVYNYHRAREYHRLGSAAFFGLLAVLPLILFPRSEFLPSILAGVGVLTSTVVLFFLWCQVLFEFLMLPSDFQIAKESGWKPIKAINAIKRKKSLFEESDPHAAYHAELKTRRLSLKRAYACLIFLGPFGEHKALLEKPEEMMFYSALFGIVLWPVVFITGMNVFELIAKSWSAGLDDPTRSLVLISFVGLLILSAIAALLLACKLLIDATTLPRMVQKHNEQIQRELLAKYLYPAVNLEQNAAAQEAPKALEIRSHSEPA